MLTPKKELSTLHHPWRQLDTIRYGHNFDITHKNSASFCHSIKAFEDSSQKDKKQRGLGHVKNTPEIPSQGTFNNN